MKRFLVCLLALMMLSATALGHAEDLGVQIIGGSDFVAEPVSLDDMQLEQTYTIDGYAKVAPLKFEFWDAFDQYEKDFAGNNSEGGTRGINRWMRGNSIHYKYICPKHSGTDADFAMLQIDVTNLQKSDVDFTQEAEVKVIYDNDYEFAGWVRMFNYNYDSHDGNNTLVRPALDPANSEPTAMMYTTHMVFGCTLPNAVVEGKEPLRMEIKLGDNELTYHIRK